MVSTAVRVFVLPTGFLYLPHHWVLADGNSSHREFVPDYSFLICHPDGSNVLFDLGLRKDFSNYPPIIRRDFKWLEPYVPEDVSDILRRGQVKPQMIDKIVLSHLHFDHVGDITRFPDTEILIGPGSLESITPGYPTWKDSPFDGKVFKHSHVTELARVQYHPFPKGTVPEQFPWDTGFDVFGDGSFFILDAPGHMVGHQMAIARTGPNEWVAMGGDSCHSRALLEDPGSDIATTNGSGPAGASGMHKMPADARDTISKCQQLHQKREVFMMLAHDAQLEGVVPLYPQSVNGWSERDFKVVQRQTPLTLQSVKKRHASTWLNKLKRYMSCFCCLPINRKRSKPIRLP